MCTCTLGGSSRLAYPIFIVLGITAAYIMGRWILKEPQQRRHLRFCTLAALPGIVIGARAVYVALHWPYYAPNPVSVFFLSEGGFVFHGGFILGCITSAAACRIRGISWGRLMDAVSAPIALGYGIGRIGCFFNGCCAGQPAQLPWALVYEVIGPSPRHPTQLYAAAAGAVICVILYALHTRWYAPLRTFSWFLLLHGTYRLVVEQYRREPVVLFSLTHGEFFSILMIISAVILIAASYRHRKGGST